MDARGTRTTRRTRGRCGITRCHAARRVGRFGRFGRPTGQRTRICARVESVHSRVRWNGDRRRWSRTRVAAFRRRIRGTRRRAAVATRSARGIRGKLWRAAPHIARRARRRRAGRPGVSHDLSRCDDVRDRNQRRRTALGRTRRANQRAPRHARWILRAAPLRFRGAARPLTGDHDGRE